MTLSIRAAAPRPAVLSRPAAQPIPGHGASQYPLTASPRARWVCECMEEGATTGHFTPRLATPPSCAGDSPKQQWVGLAPGPSGLGTLHSGSWMSVGACMWWGQPGRVNTVHREAVWQLCLQQTAVMGRPARRIQQGSGYSPALILSWGEGSCSPGAVRKEPQVGDPRSAPGRRKLFLPTPRAFSSPPPTTLLIPFPLFRFPSLLFLLHAPNFLKKIPPLVFVLTCPSSVNSSFLLFSSQPPMTMLPAYPGSPVPWLLLLGTERPPQPGTALMLYRLAHSS